MARPFAPTVVDSKFHPKLRRWDNPTSASADGIPMTNDRIPLENGVEVKFSDATYKTGDYWGLRVNIAAGPAISITTV